MSDDAFATINRLLNTIEEKDREIRELRARLNGEPVPAKSPSLGKSDSTPVQPLTQREIEVARLICQRLTTDAIADRLVTKPATIKKHREHIKAKMGSSDAEGLEARREEWDTA